MILNATHFSYRNELPLLLYITTHFYNDFATMGNINTFPCHYTCYWANTWYRYLCTAYFLTWFNNIIARHWNFWCDISLIDYTTSRVTFTQNTPEIWWIMDYNFIIIRTLITTIYNLYLNERRSISADMTTQHKADEFASLRHQRTRMT